MNKIDGYANVSPIRTLHYNVDGTPSAGSRGLDGGCALRLSIAVTLAAAFVQRDKNLNDEEKIAEMSLSLADHLIREHNEDVDALLMEQELKNEGQ